MAKSTTGFFQRVHDLVELIPPGKVMTYGQIAKRLGGFYSGRTVGFAMAASPPERRLPCHRVVNRLGEMAPGHAFGGAERQRRLLRSEGVRFHRDGRINLEKSLLQFDDETEPPPTKRKKRKTQ
ncbi:MAG: methylated-DNA--[protein]-cysteine S-methyltransferase [Planctomycetaceae bacterium]|nr:methylated-DNA--[protein]-cysteine S-methyltransferase [Planctomycetaceae bacterium]